MPEPLKFRDEFERALARYQAAELEFNAASQELGECIGHRELLAKREIFRALPVADRPAEIRRIQSIVADFFGTTIEQLTGKVRANHIVTPRHVAMALIRDLLSLTYVEIGLAFGGRDHGSVIWAEHSVNDQKEASAVYRAKFNHLEQLCRATLSPKAIAAHG